MKNAEDLLTAAKACLDSGIDHASFHLSLLALEEIGKMEMESMRAISLLSPGSKPIQYNLDIEDHERKAFIALWGPSFGSQKQTKQLLEENQRLAKNIHERSWLYLYSDPNISQTWSQLMKKGEAKELYEFVSIRLKLAQSRGDVDLDKIEAPDEDLGWFLKAQEDDRKRNEIWGHKSQDKLLELKDVKLWIKWLREIYSKNETEMREYAEKELHRKKPEGEDALAPKYRMRIRIQTPSHLIRNNAFTKWNEGVHGIKIYKSDRKDATKLTKGEMLIDITLPKGLHTGYVWEHGLFMSKTVVIALNVGTLGVFWWNVQKDISTFYEEIIDLEADPKGGIGLVVAPHKRLHVNFDEAKLVLNEDTVRNVYHVVAFFFREHKKLEEFLKRYAMALTFFSKTDIHLRLEVNAFEEFYHALKIAMKIFGDWDGASNFEEAVRKQYEKVGEIKDVEKTLNLGLALEADEKRQKHHPITLTEVLAMKIYCDHYIQIKAREYFENMKKDEPDL